MSISSLPSSHFPLIIFTWLSILVYLLISIVIVRHRRIVPAFKNPFFTLALAQSIPSILLLLHIELLVRPREYGLFQIFRVQTNSICAAILLGLQTAQKSQVIFFHISIALNRFTAFVTVVFHRKV
ncbi:hypothetical protein PFISCL1PPCAC_23826, partial [Pristionchus fissidentatus]